ncbi:hypothetical protein ABBQ38_013370 [Trebouxia sp. C0009 RCD-2024]
MTMEGAARKMAKVVVLKGQQVFKVAKLKIATVEAGAEGMTDPDDGAPCRPTVMAIVTREQ